jgi:predicted tellurium resistance membrane protein TerC
MALVADGAGFHIPKGYLYFAMAFSVLVEGLNIAMSKKRTKAAGATRSPARPVVASARRTGEARAR